ncbi:HNH endonuclease [Arthrobacter sp. 8AJ]|uniref:HNH endonuclease n=1 Tax=Arthrobacter sp. 8AJ TaxID=2653130 RepID=UPI001F3797A5|nr:HNH endonuclease signature motif containing protein [Arthrobacter sp. 8AJ]
MPSPNCTIPAPWCEAHHITYWSHGGPTTTNNGVLLCSHHHHLVHKEQWTITTTPGTPAQTPQQNHYFKPPRHPTHHAKSVQRQSVRLHP